MLSCVPEPDLEEATTQLFDVQSFPGSTALTRKRRRGSLPASSGPWIMSPGRSFVGWTSAATRAGCHPIYESSYLLSEVLLKAPTYDKDGKVVSADDRHPQSGGGRSHTAAGPDY